MRTRMLTALVTTALLAASAVATNASTITLTLTSAGSNVMGGVYIGPYTAVSGGTTFGIICDDFNDDSYLNETWTANVSTFADLSTTKWGATNSNGYYQAAWLSDQLLNPAVSSSTAGAIQYAIWQIFSPNAFNSLSGVNLTNAQTWLQQAQNQTYYAGEFSNYVIYTPTTAAPTCNGGPCPTAPPQEFLRRVPGPAPVALMVVAMFAALCYRRRLFHAV